MACPDDSVLLAMVERTLGAGQLHELELHLDDCAHCREVVAAVVARGSTAGASAPVRGDEALVEGMINDRYSVKMLLGRGGMGAVYLARDRLLGRDVALKLHRAGSGNDRLHNEAIAMAQLAHPNVVTVFEVATVDERLYVAMEYVRGGTLRSWLAAAPRNWREIVAMLVTAGSGLAAAHAAGLVHRDFKPENVLVGEDGRPRVSDFGLAYVGERPSGLISLAGGSSPHASLAELMDITETGAVLGTPAYMAPEQLAGTVIDARSDQFAFCVVAWECLFGERPFDGKTIAALAQAIERGDLRRPASTDVPQRVVEILERGLAADPASRHPDMPALLERLRVAVRPRKRRRFVVAGGGLLVVAGAALAIALTSSSHTVTRCEVGADEMTGAWDRQVRAAIRASFTSHKQGEQTFERVAATLDAYRDSWIAMRHASCEATHVLGEQSEAVHDLRMHCLDRKRDELRALTRGLASASQGLVTGSVRATLGLSNIAECADRIALSAPVRSSDSKAYPEIEAARSVLAEAHALRLLGHTDEALTKVESVMERAKALKYRPLEAEALYALGDLKDLAGDTETAIKLLEEAVVAADAGNHRRVAAMAWSTLAWLEGVVERKFERADWALKMANAAVESLGGNDELAAQLVDYEAVILETKGQLAAAKAKYIAALEARERISDANDSRLANVLNDLGGIERRLGDYTAAREHHERSLAIRKKVFGELHPTVFSSLNNLGNVASAQHDYVQAEKDFRAALAVADAVFPEQHPQIALGLSNLAEALEGQERFDDAIDTYRRSLAIYEAVRGPQHPDVADALHNLGVVLVEARKPDEARAAFERSLAIYTARGGDDPELGRLLCDLADVVRRSDARKAEQVLERAIAFDSKPEREGGELACPLTVLGELYTAQGRASDAAPLLERALVLRNADPTHVEDKVRTELALATLLSRSAADQPRAIELARSAQHDLEAANAAHGKDYRDVTHWLETHR